MHPHDIMSCLRLSYLALQRCLVKMSAQLNLEATLAILIEPLHQWSLKWCHFNKMCLVRTLVPSLEANMIQEALSS